MAGKKIPSWLLFCKGILFLVLASVCWFLAWKEIGLRLHAKTVDAIVLDCQETHGKHPGFIVRYQFRVEGDGTVYHSASNALWSEHPYAAIDRDGWQEARRSRKVPIVYDAQDPRNNRPVQAPVLIDKLLIWGAGGVLFTCYALACFLLGRKRQAATRQTS